MSELNILLADDHDIVRTGLMLLLKKTYPFASFTEAADGAEVIAAARAKNYELIVMDVYMPETDSFRTIENILILQPATRILILSQYPENIFATRYLKAGCWGYINKSASNAVILAAVKDIIENKRKYVTPDILDQMIKDNSSGKTYSNPFEKLSNREIEVAKNLLLGIGLDEIRQLMNIERTTLSTHKVRVFEKLQINNLMELRSLADEYGFK